MDNREDTHVEQTSKGYAVTRTIQVTLTRSFDKDAYDLARMVARERGCSIHRILSEKLKADAEQTLRNAGNTVGR